MRALKLSLLTALGAVSLVAAGTAVARHGADNPPGDVRDCRGCDDAVNHDVNDVNDDRNQDVNDVDVMDDVDLVDLDAAVENQADENHRGRDGSR